MGKMADCQACERQLSSIAIRGLDKECDDGKEEMKMERRG